MSVGRTLVVDDDDLVREAVCSMLLWANFVCDEARSGAEALALMESGQEYELMFSDLNMPGMDGAALLAATKERFPDLPVVMITAVHDISVAMNLIRHGAYDYLLKPFGREQLVAAARRALEHRRLKLENRAYEDNLQFLVSVRTKQLREALTTVEQSYDITLAALGDALDLKDAETEGHSKRVTAFTIAISRAMGLSSDQVRIIARGAFLHDIGKMAVPDAILRKPGALEPEEQEIMREHCYRGYQMLRKIPFLSKAAEIVYAHQERFDGTGYPRGLKGEQIPLGARIFAVADTLDAITSNRPYRAARPVSAAREEIAYWSGRQFDPEVVNIFLGMPEILWDDLRKQIDAQTLSFDV